MISPIAADPISRSDSAETLPWTTDSLLEDLGTLTAGRSPHRSLCSRRTSPVSLVCSAACSLRRQPNRRFIHRSHLLFFSPPTKSQPTRSAAVVTGRTLNCGLLIPRLR
ncbi:unnamed protein product [Musa acuminata subsp. burmannicoides]